MVRMLMVVGLLCLCPALAATGQDATPRMPPDYRGVSVRVHGIFVTPIAGAPFSATVDIVSRQKLPDGTQEIRTTINHIARDSAGRIYNERRAMVPSTFQGEPRLLESHIYDPTTHLNTFLDPFKHLARQSVLIRREQANTVAPQLGGHDGGRLTAQTDLGEQLLGKTRLHGVRKVWTVPAEASGSGAAIEIADEYWFSPGLSLYLILKHNDPRTGEQIVAVKDVETGEPDASRFQIPANFRVVDETPQP